MDLVYARSRRAAARKRAVPVRRSAINWRTVRAVAIAILSAVAWEESRMDPHALSGAGAEGLLQLMPGTAKAVAIAAESPTANILAGARYLRMMVARFNGDLELALAAYNAGPTAVEKAGGAPSIGTLRYAKNVESRATALAGCR